MALPRISATGNLTRDPDLSFTASGIARANLSIACNDRKQDENGKWVDGDTTYLDVVSWRQFAENIAESLRKGDTVTVTGRLRTRKYEKDGETKSITEVDADSIALDLKRHAATSRRVDRQEATYASNDDPWSSAGAHERLDDTPPF
jgi:single-strand DNA-binding protein